MIDYYDNNSSPNISHRQLLTLQLVTPKIAHPINAHSELITIKSEIHIMHQFHIAPTTTKIKHEKLIRVYKRTISYDIAQFILNII